MAAEVFYAVDGICIAFIAMILIGEALTFYRNSSYMRFYIMLGLMLALFIDEIFTEAALFGRLGCGTEVTMALGIAYYLLFAAIMAMWTHHCLSMFSIRGSPVMLMIVFYGVLLIEILTTPMTKLFLDGTLSEKMGTGPLYHATVLLTMLPPLIVSILAVKSAAMSRDIGKRRESISLAIFLIPLIALSIVELSFRGIPLTSVGLTVSSVCVYITMKRHMITVDRLTGIINRNEIERITADRMDKFDERRKRGSMKKLRTVLVKDNMLIPKLPAFAEREHLYIAVMDMNHFKSINDKFGHAEGDVALVDFAYILVTACEDTDLIPGRYGGDEFVIIGECDDFSEMEAVFNKIHAKCAEMKKDYEFGTSIGYAEYTSQYRTFSAFFKAADDMMFSVKHANRPKA